MVGGDILILKIFWYKQKLREVQKLAKTSGAFAIVVVSDLGGAPGLCRTRPGCDNNLTLMPCGVLVVAHTLGGGCGV